MEDEEPDASLDSHSALEIRPLLAFRDHHHLRHEDAAFNGKYETDQNQISFTPYAEMPTALPRK